MVNDFFMSSGISTTKIILIGLNLRRKIASGDDFKQVLYITVGATVESSVPSHYVHLSFSDDWFDNRK